MKKILSIVIAAAVSITSLYSVFAADAEYTPDFEMITFEGAEEVPSVFRATPTTQPVSVVLGKDDVNDITYNEYAKYRMVSTSAWSYLYYDSATYTLEDNDRLEFEFDLRTNNLSAGGTTRLMLRMRGARNAYAIAISSKGLIELRHTNGGDPVGTIGQMPSGWSFGGDEWTRYKFVFEKCKYTYTVDGDETVYTQYGKKLVGMYVNGQSVITTEDTTDLANTNPLIWPSRTGSAVFEAKDEIGFKGMYIGFSKTGSATSGIDIDNIHVAKYDKTQFTAPDRSTLVAQIRDAVSIYNELMTDSESDEAALEECSQLINEAWTCYKDASAAQSDFDAVITKLKVFSYKFAGSTTPVTLYEDDFETDTIANYTASSEAVLTHDTSAGANDPTLGGMLKQQRGETNSYPRVSYDGFSINTSETAAAEDGLNAFAEIEFDIKMERASTNTHYIVIYLKDSVNSANPFSLGLNQNGAITYGNDDHNTQFRTTIPGCSFDFDKVNRIKFVIQTTDSEGNAVQEMNQIYINGIAILESPIGFTNVSSKDMDKTTTDNILSYPAVKSTCINRLFFATSIINSVEDCTLWIDNLKISKYKKNDPADVSPVADDYPLVGAIRQKLEERNAVESSPEIYNTYISNRVENSYAELVAEYANERKYTAQLKAEAEAVTAALSNAGNTSDLSDISETDGKICVTVNKIADYGYNGSLVTAFYDNNEKLISVSGIENTLTAMAEGEQKIISVDIPSAAANYKTAKVILLENLINIRPLTKSEAYGR